MNNIYAVASSSSSTTYGNISCAIKEMITSKFPYDYFKYINVSSELAFRNMRRQFGRNTNTEFVKRKKPYLVIKPTYTVGSNDQFLNDIPLTKNFDNVQYGLDKRYLFDILLDKDHGFNLKFKMNRDRIEFDVVITLSTLHQQLDIYKFMVNQMVWDRPYTQRTSLEAMIPRSMISQISNLLHLDIDNSSTNAIPVIMSYFNRLTKYPITYKMKNSSATDEFFMYYNHDMIVTLSDLTINDGNKKNMVDDFYEVSFRVSAEFNLPGLFLLEGRPENMSMLKLDIIASDAYGNSELVPVLTLNNLTNQYPAMRNGYRLYMSSIFNTDPPVNGKDSLLIIDLFKEEVQVIIRETLSFGVNIDTVVKAYVVKDNVELIENVDWHIDWNTFTLLVNKPEQTSTYRLIIYLNNVQVNDRLIQLTDEQSREKSKL